MSDDMLAPVGELFTPNRTSAYGGVTCASRATWLIHMNEGNIKIVPPQWWLDEQDDKGRQKAKFAIWHNRYSTARKLSIWLMAPLEDFRRAKYLRRVSEFTFLSVTHDE
jgi:hypothetical protein